MSVRAAREGDRDVLHALYRDFFAELPPPEYEGVDIENELSEIDEILASGLAFVAEIGGEAVGFALARRRAGTRGVLTDLYVKPDARRRGAARELMQAVVAALRERGATHVTLWVDEDNAGARAAYQRWGFRARMLELIAPVEVLEQRLGAAEQPPSLGSIHVQTDDLPAVERAVRQFVPRLPGASRGTVLSPPRNGWIAVYDELCDREPAMLRRLARELSDRMGAVVVALGVEDGATVRYLVFERGRVVDEYLSVPEFHGALAPGDVVAMAANPTAVARLTGADPARVRAVARTARAPAELPPAPELLAQIGAALGLEGSDHGYAEASGMPGAVELPRP